MEMLQRLWIKQNEMKARIADVFRNEKGQGMVEYGLIIALVAVVVIVALTGIGTNLKAKFENIETNLQ